jgi:hypothetical protein
MPDRDVFNLVNPAWRQASRRALTTGLTDRDIETMIVRLACEDFRVNGIPGMTEIANHVLPHIGIHTDKDLLTNLEAICRSHTHQCTDIASRVARKRIATGVPINKPKTPYRVHDYCLDVIVERIRFQMFPGGLLPAFIEREGVSIPEFKRRCDEACDHILSHPSIDKLASQLLIDSGGAAVTVQRPKVRKRKMADLIHMPLNRP